MKKFMVLLAAASLSLAHADVTDILKQGADVLGATQSGNYKELLASAANRAVAELAKGYIHSKTAKIELPPSLKAAAKLARKVGGDKWERELVVSMNDAATKAVSGASKIFLQDLKSMSDADVKKLIGGGDTALSEYLQSKSGAKLRAVFRPIVSDMMLNLDRRKNYENFVFRPIVSDMMSKNSFATAYNGLNSFAQNKIAGNEAVQNIARGLGASEYLPKQGEDLNDYITQKTLNGLFAVMREKESALRGSAVGKGAGILGKVL
ncbi:DUF4197 domain-containing protein, partial [uncultured Campylobacter sp.]|uniref:DUF4197 domain-containing protein n=1 Tax=uncultured Campylobacter sp. TaxID=218934 RepID=UPI00260F88D2